MRNIFRCLPKVCKEKQASFPNLGGSIQNGSRLPGSHRMKQHEQQDLKYAPPLLWVAHTPRITRSTVAYNMDSNLCSPCMGLRHELTRFILWHWTQTRLRSGADIWLYNDDPMKVCHQIAQRVELLVLG